MIKLEKGQLEYDGGSIIIKFLKYITGLMNNIRLLTLIHRATPNINTPYWLNEVYILVFFAIVPIIMCLAFKTNWRWILWLGALLAGYRLIDLFGYVLACFCDLQNEKHKYNVKDELIEDNKPVTSKYCGYYMYVRSPLRWLLCTIINVFEIIFCFAYIYYFFGEHFIINNCNSHIDNPLTAIYYSLVNTLTLGTGDIYPGDLRGQFLVIIHLFYFICYFIVILPIVMGSIKVIQYDPNNPRKGNTENS